MSTVPIDRERVRSVAKLAALSLTDDEELALARDLDAIVRYFEELGTLDTRDVPPTTSVQLGVVRTGSMSVAPAPSCRDDVVQPGLSHEDALAQAPRVEQDGFAVPAFVDADK
jgi:aspartyl-tRNA(Asn)/glutamyl-tRNA(Gln) amidotransferase subunit C